MSGDIYTSGSYLEKNPEWHLEESPWKAQQVMRMLAQNHLTPRTICEVGCGAGEILRQMQAQMDRECIFQGYDISPQAFELSKSRANERLHFKLADFTKETNLFFDLILIMDVIEHLEDYFSFLRAIKPKSNYKILHIPLDLSVETIVRKNGLLNVREAYGHIHYFTRQTAIQMLKDVGYEVLDYFYTASSVELPSHELRHNLVKLPRKVFFAINKDLAARTLGGLRLLILAK